MYTHYGLIDWASDNDGAETAINEFLDKETNFSVTLKWGMNGVWVRGDTGRECQVTFPVTGDDWDQAIEWAQGAE